MVLERWFKAAAVASTKKKRGGAREPLPGHNYRTAPLFVGCELTPWRRCAAYGCRWNRTAARIARSQILTLSQTEMFARPSRWRWRRANWSQRTYPSTAPWRSCSRWVSGQGLFRPGACVSGVGQNRGKCRRAFTSASGSSSGKRVFTARWYRTECSRLAAFSMKSLNETCFCVKCCLIVSVTCCWFVAEFRRRKLEVGKCSAGKNKLSEISGRFQWLESVIIPAVPNLVFQIHFKPQTLCVRCPFKSYHLTS